MAALLRSARLLKLSPSGLYHVTGTKTTGPSLGRLYSTGLGGWRTGVCSRNVFATGNTSSALWTSASVCARKYSMGIKEKDDMIFTELYKKEHQFNLDRVKLDLSVRNTGSITKTLLLDVFNETCRTDNPSSNQALLLLGSCGSQLPGVSPESRTELAHRVWEKLLELGAEYNVSHYNTMLKVYLQNDFKFSPTDFLAKMEAANIKPNRVTYLRLLSAYCENGEIDGAGTILGIMKSEDLPLNEAVFNSLVTGHARAGDIESAKNVFTIMQGAGIKPGPHTYVALLNAYAEKGDMDNLKNTLEAAEGAKCTLMDRDIAQVIFTLAKSGHQQHVPEIAERLQLVSGFIPDLLNLCVSLTTHGLDDTAFYLLTSPSAQAYKSQIDPKCSRLFLEHCINIGMPAEKIVQFCNEVVQSNMHTNAFNSTLFYALKTKTTALSLALMKMMKEKDLPIRHHYFWPLLSEHVKDKNTDAVLEVLKHMQELEVYPDLETFGFIRYTFPSPGAPLQAMRDAGISLDPELDMVLKAQTLAQNDLDQLYTLLSDPSLPPLKSHYFQDNLLEGFKMSNDVEIMSKITKLLHKDKRFWDGDNGWIGERQTSNLLYKLINLMSKDECMAQDHKLQNFITQLRMEANTIDEKKLALKQAISELLSKKKLHMALALKQLHEDAMTTEVYCRLINQCCRHDRVEDALSLKGEMTSSAPSAALNVSVYMNLFTTLCTNDKVDEAVDILNEMKLKEMMIDEEKKLFFIFKRLALKRDCANIERLQDTIFTLGLITPTANLCSQRVSAYLQGGDFTGALEALLDCQEKYNVMPRIHDTLVGLIKEGETELLQKAVDKVGMVQGEMSMLYYLFCAFLESGRYHEASQIIKTSGIRAKPIRLQWFANRCITSKWIEPLEQMVELTDKLFECDRDDMYSYILRLCKDTKNWKHAETVWTKMREEGVIPTNRTLALFADIRALGGEESQRSVEQQEVPESSDFVIRLLSLYKKGEVQEAYNMLKTSEHKHSSIVPYHYNGLIRSLLSYGHIEEAMDVRDIAQSQLPGFSLSVSANSLLIVAHSKKGQIDDALRVLDVLLQKSQMPSQKAITALVQLQRSHGDVAGIKKVMESLANHQNTKIFSMTIFTTNIALAHIKK